MVSNDMKEIELSGDNFTIMMETVELCETVYEWLKEASSEEAKRFTLHLLVFLGRVTGFEEALEKKMNKGEDPTFTS